MDHRDRAAGAGRLPGGRGAGADLHVHSHFSDGEESPGGLLRRARGRLALISICDHDTLRAYDDLAGGDEDPGVRILPGIEVSAGAGDEELHILGYFPGGFRASFRGAAARLEEDRRQRIRDGVLALRRDGIALRWELLRDVVGPGVPCRSHVARALVRMGVARSPNSLYRRHLGRDRFPPPAIGLEEAIALVRGEGGIPVLAHPRAAELESHGERMIGAGLMGIELHTPWLRGGDRRATEAFARRHRLLETGGSDHHADTRRRRFGDFQMAPEQIPERLLGGGN